MSRASLRPTPAAPQGRPRGTPGEPQGNPRGTRALRRTAAELRAAVTETRGAWTWTTSAIAAAFVLAALFPVTGLVRLDGPAATLYMVVAAAGLSLTVGMAGIPSLAQGAFVGVGALVAAHLRANPGWPPLAAALVGSAGALAAGTVVGLGLVRLRPAFAAVATWIATWVFVLGVVAFPSVSGGAQGLEVPQGDLAGIALGTTAHYELALVLLALVLAAATALSRGAVGPGLAAVRQRPPAASALGVPAVRLRLAAFIASAGIAGLAGGFAVQLAGVFDPRVYGPFLSFALLVAVLLGGTRGAVGAALGALAFGLIEWSAGKVGGLAGLGAGRLDALVAALLVLYALGLDVETLIPRLRERRFLGPARSRTDDPALAQMHPRPAHLQATALSKRFGHVTAVTGLSLDLRAGSVTALIGPNGSGKTTALRLISGTLEPDEGVVLVDGNPLPSTTRARAELGVVRTLQATAVLAHSSALENVLVGAGLRRRFGGVLRTLFATPLARAETRATRAKAGAILDRVGLGDLSGRAAGELSGAEQRILMIAAALATEPRVLLLDEPSAGASAAELGRLTSIIESIRAEGLAVLVVEHNLRLVRSVADHVVVLDAGRMIAEGSTDEVARSEAVRTAYLGRRWL